MAMIEVSGTIRGQDPDSFDPAADALFLYEAFKGLGTNDRQLRTLITDRNNEQRQMIATCYEEQQGEKLVDRIMRETSGKYERTLVALMIPPAQYDAYFLRRAMDGIGTTESLLMEIICTRNGSELAEIREAFQAQTSSSLVTRVAGETRGDFEKYLVMCLERGRSPDEEIDEEGAAADVETLYRAGEAKWGTNEDAFIEVFATRSFVQLGEICRQYERAHGKTLQSVCKAELGGHFETAVIETLDHSFNTVQLWGEKIRDTMKGLGTDDEGLIRLLVTRSERDLATIRDRFGEDFGEGRSLENWVASDTSGHFEKVLLSILTGDQREPIRTHGDDAEVVEDFDNAEAVEDEPDATSYDDIVRLTMVVHLADVGDVVVENAQGEWVGSKGENRRLEGFQIVIDPPVPGLSCEYMGHFADRGDSEWQPEGSFCGSRGQARGCQGFGVRLVGESSGDYVVRYRGHLGDIGDTPEEYLNGDFCGTRGESRDCQSMLVVIDRS